MLRMLSCCCCARALAPAPVDPAGEEAELAEEIRVEGEANRPEEARAKVFVLKKAKLAGTPSEAMILAAEFESGEGVAVKTLVPPEGAQPGDIVFLEGMQPAVAPSNLQGTNSRVK